MDLLILFMVFLLSFPSISEAQAKKSNTTTDSFQAKALNSIFAKWGISADITKWNTTGDICTGAAVGDMPSLDDTEYNPFIKCSCSSENSTVCRITGLKVYGSDVSGPIPDELWTLTSLTNLNLGLNVLSGNLSSSIKNLTRMQYLSIGINSLSGPLPEELGLLSDLRSLGIGGNNFSGPIPPSLGNLAKLEQLYIDSCGVSGEIPTTFSKLGKLRILYASGNDFGGKFPDFIGGLANLTNVNLQGNAFEGPIPSTLSKLTSLTELRIGNLRNGSSTLGFIRNMTSLSRLVLRDAKITGTIPDSIGSFASMVLLDLSFNTISGAIPDSLFKMSVLSHLFLGNNNFSGSLPSQKSVVLKNLDVSYNSLVGKLPMWAINEPSLNFNGIVNNFTIEPTQNSTLPTGLDCLQIGFPCFRNAPRYSEFAVKCGGSQIKSASGVIYEDDDKALGPANYYVTGARRWGVSNNGYFTDSNNPQNNISSSVSQFKNTLDAELFQSARISASSLRYFGLGLENGNYTLLLQFAEIAIVNDKKWQSLGRRIFDIYIQGTQILKDFDVREEAKGESFRTVVRSFNASVKENYLEIHLFWAGKGTCCIPSRGTYGPIISAISVTPNFIPKVKNKPPSKSSTGVIIGASVAAGVIISALICIFIVFRRMKNNLYADDLQGIEHMPHTFSYSDLKTATEGFSPSNKLGEGGFGPVYRGTLSDGRLIAVKQLGFESNQGKKQFAAEIATISAVQHRNLVQLYGCCVEGNHRLLVYEYLQNKSVDNVLYGKTPLTVDWKTRYNMCLGIAKGLAYLHEESRLRIVHRDVKASNILLDNELVPKISDFGLAKLYDAKKTHISTHVAGTLGYLAPEYAMRGQLTEKVDVFAFGVVLLEIISGRPSLDSTLAGEKMYLLSWAWTLYEDDRAVDLVDTRLTAYDVNDVKRLVYVSLLCTQTSRLQRPAMSRVVAMIAGDVEVELVASRPGYLDDWKVEDGNTFTSNTSTSADVSRFTISSASG